MIDDEAALLDGIVNGEHQNPDWRTVAVDLLRRSVLEIRTQRALAKRWREIAHAPCRCGKHEPCPPPSSATPLP